MEGNSGTNLKRVGRRIAGVICVLAIIGGIGVYSICDNTFHMEFSVSVALSIAICGIGLLSAYLLETVTSALGDLVHNSFCIKQHLAHIETLTSYEYNDSYQEYNDNTPEEDN